MYRVLVSLFLLIAACSTSARLPDGAPTNCDEATVRLQECLAVSDDGAPPTENCQRLADATAAVCSDEKADGWQGSLCNLGVLHYCVAETCDIPSVANGDECAEYLDEEGCASCDYYLCKEAADGDAACGEEGYYLGFGFKYCERISQVTRPDLSEAGQAWLDSARRCLMEEIELQVDDEHSCSEVKQIALASHPDCYTDTGFCELPWRDMMAVFMTVDPTDVEMRQVFSTGIQCFGDLFP